MAAQAFAFLKADAHVGQVSPFEVVCPCGPGARDVPSVMCVMSKSGLSLNIG